MNVMLSDVESVPGQDMEYGEVDMMSGGEENFWEAVALEFEKGEFGDGRHDLKPERRHSEEALKSVVS